MRSAHLDFRGSEITPYAPASNCPAMLPSEASWRRGVTKPVAPNTSIMTFTRSGHADSIDRCITDSMAKHGPTASEFRPKRTAIIFAATLALLAALSVAAQAKKTPVRRAVPVVVPLVLPPADSHQLAAAALTIFGDYACELGKSLRVMRSPKFDGYVDLQFDKQLFTLKPVLSHTGALRLEDVRARLLLVQIDVKSMLMDVKIGRRLVDDCVHETQSENRRQLAAAPAGPGLGIDSDKATADTAAQAASVAVAAPPVAPLQAAIVAPALSASAAAATPEQAASAAAAAPPPSPAASAGTR